MPRPRANQPTAPAPLPQQTICDNRIFPAARILLTAEEMRRAIARIAHEILERTGGARDVMLVGLYHEGIHLARRLAGFMQAFEGIEVPIGQLDFSDHRDDVREKGPIPALGPTLLPVAITGKTIILVDDVLYTGRSIRAALDALMDHGRPSRVQVAVLVDRGHRELPIRADYVGKNVPTAKDEWVIVQLQELHLHDSVFLIREAERNTIALWKDNQL